MGGRIVAWVRWVDGAVVNNALHSEKGSGDDWREVFDEVVGDSAEKRIVIVEEDGKLYRREENITYTYDQKREKEYPHVKDQLDMIYKDQVNGTTTWRDAITAVKEKYPKE